MPCYDPRDSSTEAEVSRIRTQLINEFQHNSNIAEMLCSLMKGIHPDDHEKIFKHIPGLQEWFEEHKKRDAAKEGS